MLAYACCVFLATSHIVGYETVRAKSVQKILIKKQLNTFNHKIDPKFVIHSALCRREEKKLSNLNIFLSNFSLLRLHAELNKMVQKLSRAKWVLKAKLRQILLTAQSHMFILFQLLRQFFG